MSLFERWLTLWVALCIVVGIALGHFLPGLFQAIGAAEIAKVNLPMAALIWLMMSLACWHISCAPMRRPVSRSATSFMKQRPGSSMTVRALPNMVHLPDTALMPCSLASASVRPTTAISGLL